MSNIIVALANITGLGVVSSGYLLMIMAYTGISLLLLLISRALGCGIITQWAMIFLLLSHPSFNDFRSYIIIEPIFWLLWLFAIHFLLAFYKSHTILGIFIWLIVLLLATNITVSAWFWLLLFPFGTLLWKPWRRKSVAYALCGYALIVGILLFLPFHSGMSPFYWLKESILANPDPLSNALRLDNNNWVKEGDVFMSSVFVVSGATSLIIMRACIGLSVVCVFLGWYAISKKQYAVFKKDHLRIIVSAIIFDLMITVILLLLSADNRSVLSFSMCLLLLLFSSLGLSYVFKKMYLEKYSRLQMLVIVWCLVAYFASGFIIFGPKQSYLKEAAQDFIKQNPQNIVYSDDSYFLFYIGQNPRRITPLSKAINVSDSEPVYFAHAQSRKSSLPHFLKLQTPIKSYSNSHGDSLILYKLMPRMYNEKQSSHEF
ncbi:MAG: hypothetical protein KGV50_05565 [Gammaproteobacteria bacterium]|nr:hypothetical protein [Gammaproteobacteria bacterium]